MKKYILGAAILLTTLSPALAQAQTTACAVTITYSTGLNNCQVQAILNVLVSFYADSTTIANVNSALTGGSSPTTTTTTTTTASYPSGCTSYIGYSSTTGNACNGSTPTYPPGCSSTTGFSSTTGNACNGTTTTTTTASAPTITVTSPNGNAWQSGTNQTISWTDSAYASNVYYTVFVTQKNGVAYGVIADNVYGTSVQYNVGTIYSGRLASLAQGESAYYIQVVRQTPPQATSFTTSPNASFTITVATTLAPAPDLTAGATTVTPSTVMVSGIARQNIMFSATVSNVEPITARNFPNVFEVSNSAGSSFLGGVETIISSLSSLSGGSTSISFSQRFDSPGTYSVRACANRNTSGTVVIGESDASIASNCGEWKSFTVSATPQPVDGFCGYGPGSYLSSPSATDLCALGTVSDFKTNSTNYSWTCLGSNNGVNASCSAKPIVTLSFPQSPLSFSTTQGGSIQSSPLTLTNTSGVNVTYTVNFPNQPSWLTTNYVAPAWSSTTYGSSVVYANSSSGFTVSVNPAGLTPGTYTASVVFVGNFAGYSKTILVTLTVTAPVATVTIPTLDFTMSDSTGNINVTATSAVTPPSITITIPEPIIPRWTSSTNATSCTASNGWTGSKATNNTAGEYLYPQVTTTYTLSCSNSAGTVTKSVTVVPVAQTYDYGSEAYAPRSSQTASVLNALFSASNTGGATFGYQWNTNLQLGSTNTADVGALQIALTKEGVFSGEITGGFYTQTFLAVKAFQKKYDIEATGFVGPDTRAKLNTLYAK